jgi:hypothetical protein
MIRADEVGQGGGFIETLGEADHDRHAAQVIGESSTAGGGVGAGRGKVVDRVHSGHEQHADLAARELGAERRELGIAAAALKGRRGQVDRVPIGANHVVDRVAQRLDAQVLAAGDDQPTAARLPEAGANFGNRRLPWRRGQAVGSERGARTPRHVCREMARDVGHLAGCDAQPPVGIGSGQ